MYPNSEQQSIGIIIKYENLLKSIFAFWEKFLLLYILKNFNIKCEIISDKINPINREIIVEFLDVCRVYELNIP